MYCPLDRTPSAALRINFNKEDVRKGRVSCLPFARLVSCIAQPADFSIAANLPSLDRPKAIAYFQRAARQPTVTTAVEVSDPRSVGKGKKRARAYQDQAEIVKSSLASYHQATAASQREAICFNQQLSLEEPVLEPAAVKTDQILAPNIARIISNGQSRSCQLLESREIVFKQESDAIKQQRLEIMHAIQALTAELVMYPGMNHQLVAQVAQVPEPSEMDRSAFLQGRQ